MNIIPTILIAAVASLSIFVGAYKYLPLGYFESENSTFGSTITTINGSDTLSSSRTTINTNFSNLNTDKIEATQTTLSSLATIGTITTGVWNGTAIGVGYGGTGTTSPTANQVMIGNGSSGFKVIGFGTSGQFLTSAGAATVPSWTTSSLDQAASYTWTGHHIFSSLFATAASTTNATTTSLWFTGITSSLLKTDSAGKVTAATAGTDYASAARISFAAAGPSASTGYATTTLVTIPAGTMTASSTIEININGTSLRNGTSAAYSLRLADGTSILTHGCAGGTNGQTIQCKTRWFLSFNSATSQNYTEQNHDVVPTSLSSIGGSVGTKSVNFTGAVTLYLQAEATAASNTMVIDSVDVQVRP